MKMPHKGWEIFIELDSVSATKGNEEINTRIKDTKKAVKFIKRMIDRRERGQ